MRVMASELSTHSVAAPSAYSCAARKGRDVFVGAIDGFFIPLPPTIAGSNIHHDGQHLVNPQKIPYE
jgi:hypothetical protein